MTENPSDIGWYYYFIHDTWGVEECATILRGLMGGEHSSWVDALNASEKIHDGEVGRAGGVIFIRTAGPSFTTTKRTWFDEHMDDAAFAWLTDPANFPTSPSTDP